MAYRNNNYTVTFQSPLNTTHKMTAQGMSQGFQMGGPWGMLIGAIAGTVTGGIVGKMQTKEAWKTFQSQLKAADAQNKATLTELSRNLSEISRQRAVLSMETQSALAYNQAKATKDFSSARATLAAADQVGSAVQYAKGQVELEASQQDWMTRFNYETQQWNLNVQAQNLINTADAQFVGVNVEGPKFNAAEALQDLFSAGASIAQSYASKGGGGSSKSGGQTSNYIQKRGDTWSGKTNWSVGSGGLLMNGRSGSSGSIKMSPQVSSMLGL